LAGEPAHSFLGREWRQGPTRCTCGVARAQVCKVWPRNVALPERGGVFTIVSSTFLAGRESYYRGGVVAAQLAHGLVDRGLRLRHRTAPHTSACSAASCCALRSWPSNTDRREVPTHTAGGRTPQGELDATKPRRADVHLRPLPLRPQCDAPPPHSSTYSRSSSSLPHTAAVLPRRPPPGGRSAWWEGNRKPTRPGSLSLALAAGCIERADRPKMFFILWSLRPAG
jgi:hypothetical protein